MSNFFCFCGYSCDSIPYMSDLIIKTYLVMRVGVRPALPSGSVLYSGSILIVYDCVHSWKCYCFCVIYINDVCVSVRTPKHFCDELTSFFKIISKCRIPFHQTNSIHLYFWFTYNCHVGNVFRGDNSRHSWRSIWTVISRADINWILSIGERGKIYRSKGLVCFAPH